MQADSGVYRIEEAFFLLILFHMMLLLNLATIHLSPNNKNDWLSVGLCQYVRVLHLSKLPPRAHHTLSETKLHVPINFLVAHTTFISCLCVLQIDQAGRWTPCGIASSSASASLL